MRRRLKKLLVVCCSIALIPTQAFAQTSGSTSTQSTRSSGTAEGDANLATPTGHELNVTIGLERNFLRERIVRIKRVWAGGH